MRSGPTLRGCSSSRPDADRTGDAKEVIMSVVVEIGTIQIDEEFTLERSAS
jgi:hypothetical protein